MSIVPEFAKFACDQYYSNIEEDNSSSAKEFAENVLKYVEKNKSGIYTQFNRDTGKTFRITASHKAKFLESCEEHFKESDGDEIELNEDDLDLSEAASYLMNDEVQVEEEETEVEEKPKKAPRKTVKKEKAQPKSKDLDYIDGICDYSKIFKDDGLKKITNLKNIIDSIIDGIEIKDNKIPESFKNDTKIANLIKKDAKFIKYSIAEGKMVADKLSIKYAVEYSIGDESNLSVQTNYIKYDKSKPQSYDGKEKELFKAYEEYVTTVPSAKDLSIDVKNNINNDVIYDLKSMEKKGVFDISRNIPLSNFSYYYENNSDLIYTKQDYLQLFSYLRFERKNFTKTDLKSAMKMIYSNRRYILDHEMIKSEINKYWDTALENLEGLKEDNEINKSWLSILKSTQAKNIIIHGYPSNKAFDKFMNELLTLQQTKKLLMTALFKISFIFSPFAIYINELPAKVKDGNHQNNVNLILTQLTHSPGTYSDCVWAKAVIDDVEDNDKHTMRFYFNNDKFNPKDE